MKKHFPFSIAMLLLSAISFALSPWVPRDAKEEISSYSSIVEVKVIDSDLEINLTKGTEDCHLLYHDVEIVRNFKGKYTEGKRIVVGAFTDFYALKLNNKYVLFLGEPFKKDYFDFEYSRCPKSKVLNSQAIKSLPVFGPSTTLAIESNNQEPILAATNCGSKIMFDGYDFELGITGEKYESICRTSYSKFIDYLKKFI